MPDYVKRDIKRSEINLEQNVAGVNDFGKSREQKLLTYMFLIYIFLSFFEIYLSAIIGNITRYYLLVVIGVYLYTSHFKIHLNYLSKSILIWFFIKMASLLWSNHTNMGIVQTNIISQVGMTLLVVTITSKSKDVFFLRNCLRTSYWCSFLFGILSIIFRGAFLDNRFVARQVLTLWGQQNDPNNCSAFLGIGIALASYSLFCEKRHRLLNILVIIVNAYAIILTGSRGGFLLLWLLVSCAAILPNWNRQAVMADTIKKVFVFAVVGVVCIFVIVRFIPSASLTRVISFDEYQGGTGRMEKWNLALDLIKSNPILGKGWGGYTIQSNRAIHNTFLTLWCDTGILGLIVFLYPIIHVFVKSIKNKALLPSLILLAGIFPAITVDSINKRFFWNSIIISYLLINYLLATGKHIEIWDSMIQSQSSIEDNESELEYEETN